MNPNYKDYAKYTLRSAAILTTSVVYSTFTTDFGSQTFLGPNQLVDQKNQMVLLVDFTIGSLTSGDIFIEFSDDQTNWHSETYDDVAAATGVITERVVTRRLGATGKYRISVPIKDRYVRVGVQGVGTVTGSSMTIDAIIGNV